MRPIERLTGFVFFFPIGRSAYSFSLRITFLGFGHLVTQSQGRMPNKRVPREDTLSSKGRSTLGCQNTIINDVPCSWNMRYLYYFNGFTLFGRISDVDLA